ncbi:hypothetical protein PRK78_002532 [Emydomyces testavorans]|uniref:Uncharacterized protein n=1 Tax=Emydomyces testavorans TaxID=2070801 RepID=A0AAF0IHN4_9EURO|nr:hypothetical protein PRK78_002532 [Emydomyces testavorans]
MEPTTAPTIQVLFSSGLCEVLSGEEEDVEVAVGAGEVAWTEGTTDRSKRLWVEKLLVTVAEVLVAVMGLSRKIVNALHAFQQNISLTYGPPAVEAS